MGNGFSTLRAMGVALVASAALLAAPAFADVLHGVGSEATIGGVQVTPNSSSPLEFGFTHSPPGTGSGDFLVEVLVPNTVGQDVLNFMISGTNTANSSVNSVLKGSFTSGFLVDMLGLNADPANGIGAFLPATQVYVPSATGYFVYQFDFGNVNFGTGDPTFASAYTLPVGTVILAYQDAGQVCHGPNNCFEQWTSTANSGGLFLRPPSTVPEPATLSLIGAGLVGVRFLRRKRKA